MKLGILSREYKVMLDHGFFIEPESACDTLRGDLRRLARRLATGGHDGSSLELNDKPFKITKRQRIEFFDTPDQTLLVRGLILRRREDGEQVDLTLKARSEDWCLAAAAEVQADKGLPEKRVKQKFEEDIAAPFRPRFSNSCTVKFSVGDAPPAPASLADAAAWFPGLRRLKRDGLRCAAETPLGVVHGVEVYERVWEGPELKLSGDAEATVAVILWSAGPDGRNLAGELSFRLGDGQQELDIPPAAAAEMHHYFLAVQSLEWCLPESRTKTQFAYGAR